MMNDHRFRSVVQFPAAMEPAITKSAILPARKRPILREPVQFAKIFGRHREVAAREEVRPALRGIVVLVDRIENRLAGGRIDT